MKYFAKDYKVLWHNNYWDGPLSGCLDINEELHWFDCVFEDFTECNCYYDEDDEKSFFITRTYAIYKPTKEQEKALLHNHKMFEEYVSTHCNWDYRWNKSHEENLKPRSLWKKYYNSNNIKDNSEFETNQIIGFTSMNELYKSRTYNNQV